jgi:hypothetical protein
MSLRCWLHKYSRAGVAIPAILLLLLLSGQQEKQGGYNNASHAAEQPQDDKTATTHFAPGHRVDGETYRAICDQPKNKDHADLCQQWRVAEAAEWQLWISVGTLVLLIFTFAASAIAAGAAWHAAKDAKRTADAAIEGTDHVKRVERAYVKMSHVSGAKSPDGQLIEGLIRSGTQAMVTILLRNSGNTPADVVDAFVQGWSGALPEKPPYRPRNPEVDRTDRQAFLVKDDSINFTEELDQVPVSRQEFFVFGYVTYRDQFGTTHYGGYARRYVPGRKDNNLVFVDRPNYNFDRETLPD